MELLTLDKAYLTHEAASLTARLHSTERDLQRLHAKCDDLSRHKEDLTSQLVAARADHRQAYDERLTAELARLQERTTTDLDAIRTRQREAYERDIAGLREARDAAQGELAQVKAVHGDTTQALESLRLEYAKVQVEGERERGEWRAALSVKAFELERLGLTAEEALGDLRAVKAELEAELQKNRLLHAECRRMQAEVADLRVKTAAFHRLEVDLDAALVGDAGAAVGVGGGGGGGGSGEVKGVKDLHTILEGVAGMAPANKRRLQQSVVLATHLRAKGQALSEAEAALQRQSAEVSSLQAQLRAAQQRLEAVGQPQGYLLAQLRARDEEVRELRGRVAGLEAAVRAAEEAREAAVKAQRQMEADMRTLTTQRATLAQLRSALVDARVRSSPVREEEEGGGVGLHHQTTVVSSPAPSLNMTFASPVGEQRTGRHGGDAPPPMWFRKLQR